MIPTLGHAYFACTDYVRGRRPLPRIRGDLVHAKPAYHFANAQALNQIDFSLTQLRLISLGEYLFPDTLLIRPFYSLNVAAFKGGGSKRRLILTGGL